MVSRFREVCPDKFLMVPLILGSLRVPAQSLCSSVQFPFRHDPGSVVKQVCLLKTVNCFSSGLRLTQSDHLSMVHREVWSFGTTFFLFLADASPKSCECGHPLKFAELFFSFRTTR